MSLVRNAFENWHVDACLGCVDLRKGVLACGVLKATIGLLMLAGAGYFYNEVSIVGFSNVYFGVQYVRQAARTEDTRTNARLLMLEDMIIHAMALVFKAVVLALEATKNQSRTTVSFESFSADIVVTVPPDQVAMDKKWQRIFLGLAWAVYVVITSYSWLVVNSFGWKAKERLKQQQEQQQELEEQQQQQQQLAEGP